MAEISGWANRLVCSPAAYISLLFCSLGIALLFTQIPSFSRIGPYSSIDWSSIPRVKSIESLGLNATFSDRWIVATTINPPTIAISALADLPGWQVVVIGDTKTPKNWSWPGVIFLGVDDQRKLGYRIHDLIPYRSYARKNIGYMYAIQHGAKVLYETDDDNILLVKDLKEGFDLDLSAASNGQLLVFEPHEGRTVVNPYVHFGQPSIWPRGFPLDSIAKNAPEPKLRVADSTVRPLMQQGLANGDPDVDAIFRLTRTSSGVPIRIEFDSEASPVAVPPGVMCPFNTQNTLFHRDAMWGLLVPITTTFRVCDIWRGYWVQRVLHDIGGVLAFFKPSVRQDRNVHDYFEDFISEKALYFESRRFVDFLLEWKSDEPHLFDRILCLSSAMADQGFWQSQDVELTAAWLMDLISVGFIPPTPVDAATAGKNIPVLKEIEVTPKSLTSTFLETKIQATNETETPLLAAIQHISQLQSFFRNVVLILHQTQEQNSTSFGAVKFLESIYSRSFANVVVVAKEGNESLGVYSIPHTLTLGENGSQSLFAYSILPRIMNMYPLAEGFLWTTDTLLLNYCKLLGSDKGKIWFNSLSHEGWQEESFGAFPATEDSELWGQLPGHQKRTMMAFQNIIPRYVQQYKESIKPRVSVLIKAPSDAFYIPKSYTGAIADIVPNFSAANVTSDIAIPTILFCLDSPLNFDPKALTDIKYLNETLNGLEEFARYTSISGISPTMLNNSQSQETALKLLARDDLSLFH